MKKVYEQMLATFRKSTEARRLKMAKELNFDTADQLLVFLQKKVGAKAAPKKAAPKKAAAKVATKRPRKTPVETPTADDTVLNDVIVAFDSTGSMASYLTAVRNHVKSLVPEMFGKLPNLQMGIVVFGDYCDMRSATDFGDAYQSLSLTTDQNALINFVNTSKATSGGDGDEFYELVIKKITEETPWRDGSKRLVILIADYTPHPLGYSYLDHRTNQYYVRNNPIDWRKEAHAASLKGIQFDTFKIIPQHTWFDELSRITDGVCLNFTSQEKMHKVIEAATFARGTALSKTSFMASMDAAVKSGDEELVGMYKSYSAKL